jgi:hypothetical protein
MNAVMDEVLSIQEVADSFSEHLPQWQRETNLAWLKNLHALMKEGGIWGSPNLGTVYRKCGDGWVLMENFRED